MRLRVTHTGRQAGHAIAVILHAEHVVTGAILLLLVVVDVPIRVLVQLSRTGLERVIFVAGYLDGWLNRLLTSWRTVAELLIRRRTSRLFHLELFGKIKDTFAGMDATSLGALFARLGALQLEIEQLGAECIADGL